MKKIENGLVIVIEGADGTGKSTVTRELELILKNENWDVVKFREPGSTEIGEKLRNIILYNKNIDPVTELLLHTAIRNDNVVNNINPSRLDDKIIILDRFTPSTYVYQGYLKGLNKYVSDINNIMKYDDIIDHTFILTCDADICIKRSKNDSREQNKYDLVDKEIYQKYLNGYIDYFNKNKSKTTIINTNDMEIDIVVNIILNDIIKLINNKYTIYEN